MMPHKADSNVLSLNVLDGDLYATVFGQYQTWLMSQVLEGYS